MMMKVVVASLFGLVAVNGQGGTGVTYDYTNHGADWIVAPTTGGAIPHPTCVSGATGGHNKQSPLDISSSTSAYSDFSLSQTYVDGAYTSFTLVQDGHDLTLTPVIAAGKPGTSAAMYSTTTKVTTLFTLVKYIFKTKAEHKLDGTQHDLEIQVLFTAGTGASAAHLMHSFLYTSDATAAATDYPGVTAITEQTLTTTTSTTLPTASLDLFPNLVVQADKAQKHTYTYSGSFTNPQCLETVTWAVYGGALKMNKGLVDKLTAMNAAQVPQGNYRSVVTTNVPAPTVTLLWSDGRQAAYSVATIAALFVAYFSL